MMRRKSISHAKPRRGVLVTCLAGALLTGALGTAWLVGLRVNDTASMPRGLWQISAVHAPLQRGEIVVVCLLDTAMVREAAVRGYIPPGTCPNGREPLVKPVAAIPGDLVRVTPQGVTVDGEPIENTAERVRDSAGRPLWSLPAGVYPVASGQVWLLSGHDRRSFDSRYFGPVPAANIQGVARPLWVRG